MLFGPEETALLELDDQLRRLACDRCRCQKVRCERPAVGTDQLSAPQRSAGALLTCRRCQRVGAVCNTSFQQRPGRPRLSDDRGRLERLSQQLSSRTIRRARATVTRMCHAPTRADTSQEGMTSIVETPLPADWSETTTLGPNGPDSETLLPQGSPKSLEQAGDPVPCPLPVSGHVSSGPGLESVPFDVGQDDPGFLWATSPGDMYSSWTLGLDNLPAPVTVEKETPSVDAAALCGTTLNDAANTSVTPPPEAGNPWTDRTDLCQELAELSHSLSRDVHGLLTDGRLAARQNSSSSLVLDGTSLTRRTFKSFETLGSLLDELRLKKHRPQALLTPISTRRSSTMTGARPIVAQSADRHLNMLMALHIVTSYACLNQILKHTLRSVHATVSQSANGSMGQLPRLPDILVEGLPGNSDHLRVRLFAETCVHVATGIHKRLEALAAEDTLGCGFSRPINMALGRGLCEESDDDIRDIKILCGRISSAVEEHAW